VSDFPELSGNPGLSQQQLVGRISKKQTSVSRAVRMLIDSGLIRQKKDGRLVRYWPSPEFHLAAEYL
jgi:predicted transcriptional regulator